MTPDLTGGLRTAWLDVVSRAHANAIPKSAPIPPSIQSEALMTSTTPLAVTPAEAGKLLGVCMSKLYVLLRSGELRSFRDGRSRRVLMSSIQARVNRLAAADKKWRQITPRPPRNKREKKAA
jgi:excisionase family DNA binding protein